ncbi:MAG: hypothetical protein AAB574_00405 [Patescibacteria group bacterium]
MPRNRGGIPEGETVRVAMPEEVELIKFIPRARRSYNKAPKLDPAVAKVAKLLTDEPESTVLIIDTTWQRQAKIRQDLANMGIPVATREAVGGYGEDSEPFTIAVRRVRPEDGCSVEIKAKEPIETKIPIVRNWSP